MEIEAGLLPGGGWGHVVRWPRGRRVLGGSSWLQKENFVSPRTFPPQKGTSGSLFTIYNFSKISKSDHLVLKFP